MKPDNKKRKNSNPLYVVTNNGKDVEPVGSLLDAFITKYGLKPVVDMLKVILDQLFAQVKNYGLFIIVKDFIDDLVSKMEELKDKIAPVLSMF